MANYWAKNAYDAKLKTLKIDKMTVFLLIKVAFDAPFGRFFKFFFV